MNNFQIYTSATQVDKFFTKKLYSNYTEGENRVKIIIYGLSNSYVLVYKTAAHISAWLVKDKFLLTSCELVKYMTNVRLEMERQQVLNCVENNEK